MSPSAARVRPELVAFCARQWPDLEVLSWDDYPGEFDRYCLSFSLPSLIGITEPEQVACAPYLQATVPFRSLPGAFKVGLRWAGNPGHANDRQRSIPLSEWANILQVPDASFYSLQLGKAGPPTDCRIVDLAPELCDWDQTAAALSQLDLLITVDTSVAHLAGA